MFKKIFKKKPKLEYIIEFDKKMPPLERVMVFSKILELSQQYMSYDYVNNKRKFIEKERKMKTIKIIDILNKIANDEEVPKFIRYNGEKYHINECKDMYYDETGNKPLFASLDLLYLKDEVEIIEADEEIDIEAIEELEKVLFLKNSVTDVVVIINNVINKQNELTKAVKQINREMRGKNGN